MIILQQQERSNGDVTSTLLLRKNGRASSPTIFSKNFAAGSVLSILLTDTVYFTLPYFLFIRHRYTPVTLPVDCPTSILIIFRPAGLSGKSYVNYFEVPGVTDSCRDCAD